MPIALFIGNLNDVIIAVVGGLRVASGTLSLGDVQAFILYSRQFTRPITQIALLTELNSIIAEVIQNLLIVVDLMS